MLLRPAFASRTHRRNPLIPSMLEHPEPPPGQFKIEEEDEVYATPPHYSDMAEHEANFFHAVRTRRPVVENEVFGNNTALGCHMSNYSYFNRTVAVWDAGAKKITS